MSMRGSGDSTDVKLDKVIVLITVTMRTVGFSLQPSCSLDTSRK